MSDTKVTLRLPLEVQEKSKSTIKFKGHVASNIVFDTCREPRFVVGHNGKDIVSDLLLYDNMSKHMPWLLDIVEYENTYLPPRPKLISKLCHMYGVKAVGASGTGKNNGDSDSDVISDLSDCDVKLSSEHDKPFNELTKRFQHKRNNPLESSSEEEEESTIYKSVRKESSLKEITDRIKNMLETVENQLDVKDTLLYDYFKPNVVKHVNISDVEEKLFSLKEDDTKLNKILSKALEKSNILDYIKLVSKANTPSKSVSLKYFKLHFLLTILWKSWLMNGFNLCFYGVGSLRGCTEVSKRLHSPIFSSDGINVIVDMYRMKTMDLYSFWDMLKVNLLNIKLRMTKDQIVKDVLKKVVQRKITLYIVIHGMDEFLMNNGINDVKALVDLPNVRLIGSINHLKINLVLNKLNNYKLINCNTCSDYRTELISIWGKAPPLFIVNYDVHKNAVELHSIIEALSINHRKLFSLIAQMQIELSNDDKFIGIDKSNILKDPRATTICHSESKLDSLLTEFTTHDVCLHTNMGSIAAISRRKGKRRRILGRKTSLYLFSFFTDNSSN